MVSKFALPFLFYLCVFSAATTIDETDKSLNGVLKELSDLRKIVVSQNERIGELENIVEKFQIRNDDFTGSKQVLKSLYRKDRQVDIPTTTIPIDNDIIAFHATLRPSNVQPGIHHTIIFDDAKTNFGGAYNPVTGVFTAPREGIYVFVWVVRKHYAEHLAELVIDGVVHGATFIKPKDNDDRSVSGIAAAVVHQGKPVFVRTNTTYTSGDPLTGDHGLSSFTGWILN